MLQLFAGKEKLFIAILIFALSFDEKSALAMLNIKMNRARHWHVSMNEWNNFDCVYKTI